MLKWCVIIIRVLGGETIRMINERSGARVELDRNYPQTAEDRAFWVRGSRDCVEAAKRMIEEKMQEQPVSFRFLAQHDSDCIEN